MLLNVCSNRTVTAFGIPCFHAEFHVVRGAERNKEHSVPGNPWNPVGNVTKKAAFVNKAPQLGIDEMSS